MDFAQVMELIETYLPIALQVVGVAAVIARFTPTPVDDGIILAIRKILDQLAMNAGHAENAPPKKVASKARGGRR